MHWRRSGWSLESALSNSMAEGRAVAILYTNDLAFWLVRPSRWDTRPDGLFLSFDHV
jgi:hypothetical protein